MHTYITHICIYIYIYSIRQYNYHTNNTSNNIAASNNIKERGREDRRGREGRRGREASTRGVGPGGADGLRSATLRSFELACMRCELC